MAYDPLFDSAPNAKKPFESTASIARQAPLSPVSKQPMRLFTSKSSGKEIKMWADMKNRIIFPARSDA